MPILSQSSVIIKDMICPMCSQATLAEIWYGVPTEEMIELARVDQIVLGGPRLKEYTHFCHYCQDTYPSSEG